MDSKKEFLELKDKYFETARERIEDLEKITDADKLKEIEKLQWGLFRKELLELEEFYLKWEPNGSNLSNYLEEFEPFQKKLIDIRIKFGKEKGDSSWGKPYSFRNKKDKSKSENERVQKEELQKYQNQIIKLNEKESNELTFEDCLVISDLRERVDYLLEKNESSSEENVFFELRVKETQEALDKLEKDYQDLSNKQKSVNGNSSNNVDSSQLTNTSREIERKKNVTEQRQLQAEITSLEQKPNKTSTEQDKLDAKKQKIKELEKQEKTLRNYLPLTTQISILKREIKELSNKNKTQTEEALLADNKKESNELLGRQNSATGNDKPDDKTTLIAGCGVIGSFTFLLILILTRNRKIRKKKKCYVYD